MILVTGATSLTGSRVVQRLAKEGESVRSFVHTRANEKYVPRETTEVIYGDLTNPSNIQRALKGVSVLINVAHIRFAEQIVPIAEQTGISRALFISSTRQYTRLDDSVAQEIARAEDVIRGSSLRYTILRPSMIYGDRRDKNISRLAAMVRKFPAVPLPRGGRNLVQPVFVLDLVDAIARALKNEKTVRREYVIAGPQPISYRQMVEIVAKVLDKRRIIFGVPLPVAYGVAQICRVLNLRIYFSPEQVLRFGEDRAFDISNAAREIPFTPRSFEDCLRLSLKID